jgi:hypothetical protein
MQTDSSLPEFHLNLCFHNLVLVKQLLSAVNERSIDYRFIKIFTSQFSYKHTASFVHENDGMKEKHLAL